MATCKTLSFLSNSIDDMQGASIAFQKEEKNTKVNEQLKIKSKRVKKNRRDGKIAITVLVDEKTFAEWEDFFKSHSMDKSTGIRKAVREFIKDVSNGRQFSI